MTYPKVVSIIGEAGVGKDTFADFFVREGYTKIAMADPLKVTCKTLFQIPDNQLWGPSENKTEFSRRALQVLGTDITRKVDPDVWVKLCEQRIAAFFDGKPDPFNVYPPTPFPKGLVFSDTRFPNEALFMKHKMQALQIKITRNVGFTGFRTHSSETSVNTIPEELIDYMIVNNESLETLEAMFCLIAEAEGIVDYKTRIATA